MLKFSTWSRPVTPVLRFVQFDNWVKLIDWLKKKIHKLRILLCCMFGFACRQQEQPKWFSLITNNSQVPNQHEGSLPAAPFGSSTCIKCLIGLRLELESLGGKLLSHAKILSGTIGKGRRERIWVTWRMNGGKKWRPNINHASFNALS